MNFEWRCWVSRRQEGRPDLVVSPRRVDTSSGWLPLLHVAKRILSSGVSAEKLAVMFSPWGDLSRSHVSQCWACSHSKQLSRFSRHELITFPAHAFHIQRWVSLSDQKKGPYCRVVLSDSEAHRHKKREWKHSCCCRHSYIFMSLWNILMIRHLKVNIFTIVEKQTIFLNPLSLSSSLPGLCH